VCGGKRARSMLFSVNDSIASSARCGVTIDNEEGCVWKWFFSCFWGFTSQATDSMQDQCCHFFKFFGPRFCRTYHVYLGPETGQRQDKKTIFGQCMYLSTRSKQEYEGILRVVEYVTFFCFTGESVSCNTIHFDHVVARKTREHRRGDNVNQRSIGP